MQGRPTIQEHEYRGGDDAEDEEDSDHTRTGDDDPSVDTPSMEEEFGLDQPAHAGGEESRSVSDVKQCAEAYTDEVQNCFENSAKGWANLVQVGNRLVKGAGSVKAAAQALWEVREKRDLMNLKGIDDPEFEKILNPDHLAYLRDVRKQGMAARHQGVRSRAFARLHPNARKHVDQVYQQIAKDVKKHRVLVVDGSLPQLYGTMSSPFEAVAKMLPDRTLSKEMRVVHDQRAINHGTTKYLHPPALQPTHAQIAKRILWTKGRNPGLPVLLAKKDISGAFRLLWVDPADVELFAGDLPWVPERAFAAEAEYQGPRPVKDEITVIYLVSSFGFNGSPGEWTAWGRATEEFHRAHRPSQSRRDGATGFDSKVLVDDCVLVEPWLGLRPWVSSEVFEDGVVKMLGEKAVNKEKDAIEGAFKSSQTIWGVIMDTQSEKAFLPEKRILKGAVLLSGVDFDYGNKTLTLKQLQQFRGILTGWAAVIKGLENELKAADHFLGGTDGSAIIKPKLKGEGSPAWETDRRWEDLWELFEVCRWLSAQTDQWEERFCTGLRSMLTPMERLSLPGEWESAAWVSSDATPTVVGAIDWTNKLAFRLDTEHLKVWAKMALTDEEAEDDDPSLAIHLGEMLSIVAFACKVGPHWAGHVVIYGGDNTVVRSWIQTRRSKTRGGRVLIRVLNMAEMRYGFTLLAGWWRTYHNVDADFITRCPEEEFQKFLTDKKFQEVEVEKEIRQALLDTEKFGPCFLYFNQSEDRSALLKLKERRATRQLLKDVPIPWPQVRVVEWAQQGRKICDFLQESRKLGACDGPTGCPTLMCASLGSDSQGRHLNQVLNFSIQEKAWIGIVEGPRAVAWELGEKRCKREGWGYGLIEFVTTEHGEALARRRQCLVFDRKGALPEGWEGSLVRIGVPTPMMSILKPLPADDPKWRQPVRLEIESGIPRDRMLPQPAGHVWWSQEGDREVVCNMSGPGRWPLFDPSTKKLEETFVYDRRGPGGHLRQLGAPEIWALQGRTTEELVQCGLPSEDAVLEGTRATGKHTAANLLVLGGSLMAERMGSMTLNETKAGMCPDATGADALAQMLIWFRRWKKGDLGRSKPMYNCEETKAGGKRETSRQVWRWPEAWWWLEALGDEESEDEVEEGCRRAGGRKKKTPEEVAEVVGSQVIQQCGLAVVPFHGEVGDRVEEWLEENLAGDKSQATEKAYAGAWQKWCAWTRRQGWSQEYLSRSEDPVEQENKVLAYVGYLGWLGASPNTIRQHLFAMKSMHKKTGRGDPTEKMYRIWILVNALDRKSSTRRPRRLGVTPEMLEWLGAQLVDSLENERNNTTWSDAAMVMAALELAWFYMLRAKEFADSNGVDEEMIVRGCDVRLTHQGRRADPGQATEITLQFRKTKVDQMAFGTSKTLESTGRHHLCPVEAMERMRQSWPLRFQDGHSENSKPLFRWASGRVLKRLEIQHLLQRAASGVGLPPCRFLSHSLRIGGATALFQSTADIEMGKRAGRWTSSAAQRYLHDGGAVSGISKKMAATDPRPHYTWWVGKAESHTRVWRSKV